MNGGTAKSRLWGLVIVLVASLSSLGPASAQGEKPEPRKSVAAKRVKEVKPSTQRQR